MKKLILMMTIFTGLTINAQMNDQEAEYSPCNESDMRLLETSTHFANEAIKNLVNEDVLMNRTNCFVQKPRFFHPAVCGTGITQIDTFIISTNTKASYTIVVDSSYRSCLRIRRIPTIKSLTYQPAPQMINFP
jgi:hypothetical protein